MARYPSSIQDAEPSSEIGELRAKLNRRVESEIEVRRKQHDLEAQRDGYRAAMRSARPESDMHELAAAAMGVKVLDDAIAAHEVEVARARADVLHAQSQLDDAWARVQEIIRGLSDPNRLLSSTRVAHVADLRRKVGGDWG